MPRSDDFGINDDDTAFIVAATQVEASQQGGDFEASPRPVKKRRIARARAQVDGASSDELEWSGTDDEGRSPPEQSGYFQSTTAPTQASSSNGGGGDADEYYMPDELGGPADTRKQSKYKIHIPKKGGLLPDAIFTQTQPGLDSSPSHIRGAVWKKPKPPLPPLFNQSPHINGDGRLNAQQQPARASLPQTTLNNHVQRANNAVVRQHVVKDAELAARLQAEDDAMAIDLGLVRDDGQSVEAPEATQLHEELADLPSDAFASSSSPEKSPQKEVIDIGSSQPAASQLPTRGLRGPQAGLKQMNMFGTPATQEVSASQAAKKKHAWPLKDRDEPPTHHKLDDDAMKAWVYPTNLGTVRDYQYNIVSRSLYHNTLVALPTGLGKTFIAATVMLNYYRWATNAQIIFMAPTKPLIAQQMEACYHVVGISRQDTVLMTGETTPAVRADEWLEKRVFFMTPQTVINDLKTGICDPKKIVLVVVDEAHKATGSYAYTEVIAFLRRFNTSFRVLALTATPGSSVEAVQAVIDHLGIARVELRTEQSLDIRPYTHEKKTDEEQFEYSDEQNLIMDLITKAIRPVLQKLNTQNAYWSRDPMQLSAYGLTQARQKWMASDAGRKAPMPVKGMVNAIFTVLSQLAHSIGLLKNHGIGPFYTGVREFQRNVDRGQTKGKNAKEIVQSNDWVQMMSRIDGWLRNPDFIGHPKLQYLREVVLNHFLDAGEGALGSDAPPSATRVMVFASYRDSTEEICRVLKRSEPMIRPHVFVGQAGSSTSEGMNQKRQNEVIQDFKAGKYNTLVATSIGEEGLDIGDVDLIVCYDASSSPIRMLQRIGRTGRKRVGRVVLLLMKGKEENDYAKAQDNYTYIQKSIADESKYNYRDDQSPRILPKEARPVADRRIIEIPVENSQPIDLNEKGRRSKGKGRNRPPKKFHMPDNVRTGFTKASKLGSDDESDEPAPQRKTPAKKRTPARSKQRSPSPEPEVVQLPFMGDVMLTDAQQRELERKYAHTAADEDTVVQAPDVSRCNLLELGQTRYVRHSRPAEVVSKVMRTFRIIDDSHINRMQAAIDHDDLSAFGLARARLVSPASVPESDSDLPIDSLPAPKPKKPRGRPRKKQPIQRAVSYGSAAMEGEDSEPEPTPGDMRIGTQGIDLGSRDTDGEDEDEEPDSELDAFIAKSDEVVSVLSSSLPGSVEGTPRADGRGLRKGKDARGVIVLSDVEENDENSAEDPGDREDDMPVERVVANARKKRIIADSDSE